VSSTCLWRCFFPNLVTVLCRLLDCDPESVHSLAPGTVQRTFIPTVEGVRPDGIQIGGAENLRHLTATAMALQGCCGCISLREGSKMIAITYLILGVLDGVSTTWRFAEHVTPTPVIFIRYTQLLLHMVFNGLLVAGVKCSSRRMVLAWLIYSGINNVFQSVLVFVLLNFVLPPWGTSAYQAAAVQTGIVAVYWYCFAVVYRFHQEMRFLRDGL